MGVWAHPLLKWFIMGAEGHHAQNSLGCGAERRACTRESPLMTGRAWLSGVLARATAGHTKKM